jgi:hypothetical protein
METRALRLMLSRLDPRAAPIVTRLANVIAPPSLDMTIVISVVLFVIGLGIGGLRIYALAVGYGYPITAAYVDFGTLPFVIFGSALVMALPLLVGAGTALFVANDTRTESFSLLKLTNITDLAMYQGYVAAALYRLRVLLALAFGAIPLYALPAARLTLRQVLPGTDLHTLLGPDLWVRVSYFLLLGFGLWGMNLLAAVIGVSVGLRSRSTTLAAVVAPVNVGVIEGIAALLLNTFIHPAFSVSVDDLFAYAVPLILGIGLLFAIAPYGIAARAVFRRDKALSD